MDDSKESPIFKARATHQTLWESLAGNREKEVRAACGTKRESGAAKWSSSKFSNCFGAGPFVVTRKDVSSTRQ